MARSRTGEQAYRNKRAFELEHATSCYLCGDAIDKTLKYPDPMAPEADHVVSIASGGDNLGELRIVHSLCNKIKGSKDVEAAGLAIKKTSGLWSELLNAPLEANDATL